MAPPPAAASTSAHSPFDAVVFAGGGCRCFWQSGFWSVAAPALGIVPEVVAGVSAGAAFACAALLDRTDAVIDAFMRRTGQNARNVYPGNLSTGRAVFPHEAMYRGTIVESLAEADLDRFAEGPDLRILLARPPVWAGDRIGFTAGLLAYALDRYELRVHPRWGMRFGFEAEVVSARACPDVGALADAILHSSCTPPLLPLYRREGRIVLDGGLIDNAPAHWVGPAISTLVLLTRPYPDSIVPADPGRTYVMPSEPVPIVKWDYTSPARIQQTYDLGRRDGERFVAAFRGAPIEERSSDRAPTQRLDPSLGTATRPATG